MFERISEKDIVTINLQFSTGNIINKGSLSFALYHANKSSSWLHQCALLVRAVLIDHVFEEGNKRTSAAIVVNFFEDQKIHYRPEDISRLIVKLVTKNISDVHAIEVEVKNAIIR